MPGPHSAVLAHRHARLRETIASLGLDALTVTSATNIRYLTNHAGSAGILVVARDAMHLVIDFRYQESVRLLQASPAACPGLRVWPVAASYEEALLGCLAELGVSRVGFEAADVTVARHDWWRETIVARGLTVTLSTTKGLVEQVRLIKDQSEIATLRDAASRLTPVATAVTDAIRCGMTERHVAGLLEAAMREAGYDKLAFDTIVASGPHAALPHYRAGDRVLAPGDLLVLDFGGVLDGYCCDLTRTMSIGSPSGEARRVYAAVLEAQQAAIDSVRPGVEASAVDAAARDLLQARGLGEAFGHGTGHGLGLDVHEEPRISRPRPESPPVRLAPGMVFTIEPGAYLPGWGGVRIEDDVLVTDRGCEVLTSVTREFLEVG